MKNGRTAAQKRDSFLARSILWKANTEMSGNELNPFLGLWNLAWAPNWGHSDNYAEDVLTRLKEVKGRKPGVVHEVLKQITREFNEDTGPKKGHWYSKGHNQGNGD